MASLSFSKSLDFFSLNARGLNNPNRLIEVCNMTKNHSKSKNRIIAIQETKLTKMKEEHKRILKNFGFSYEIVPADGNAGGLITLFPETFKMVPIMKNPNMLALALDPNGYDEGPIIANIYINPKDHQIVKLKESFAELDPTKPFLAMGDLNAIEYHHNPENKKLPKPNDIRVLRYDKISQVFTNFKMFDIGKILSVTDPTHYDKRTRTSNRIDYMFGNIDPKNFEMLLCTTSFSDHKCLQLCFHERNDSYRNGIWRLNDEILEDTQMITQVLRQAYNDDSFLCERYDIFKSRIRDSLRFICINNARNKQVLEKQLMREVDQSEKHLQKKNHVTIEELKEHEDKVLKLKTFQHSQAERIAKSIKNFYLDVNEGDPKSTKNLIRCLKSQQEIRKIITESGETVTDTYEIVDKFAEFFQDCYKKNKNRNDEKSNRYLNTFFRKNKRKLERFESNSLVQNNEDNPFTEVEVERAILKLNSKSAPGADGLTSDLYKSQKDFFVPILTKLFNNINESKKVPPSFEQAIIKVIQKKPNVYDIGNFRPISIINTDQKILSHIIAFRLKDVLDVLIGPHQTAHLSNRNIHTSLLKLQTIATELSKREGIVAIDFNKAFDKVDRKYMLDMIERLPLDYQTKNIISRMYENTKAIVNIEGLFSVSFSTESGVRQGCPMSALIFILAIEPLLQRIQRSKLIKSSQVNKSIVFADDISLCINLHSIRTLIIILNKFANVSGLTVNITKSKVITEGKAYKQERWKIEKVKSAKILGININIKGKMDIETKRDLINTARKATPYMGPAVSLHARAKNIETFILPKLIYTLRHNFKAKTLMKKLNSILIDQLWLGKKHNVNQEIVNTPIQDGGIGLKNLETCVLTAKLMNIHSLVFNPLEKEYLPVFKRSKAFEILQKDLQKDGIEVIELAAEKLSMQYYSTNIDLTKSTTSKELYEFLVKTIITIPCLKNINMSAMKLSISPNIVFDFISRIWKNKKLKSFDKNILYNFLMNAYLDKQEKWLKNLVPHPLCFACESSFESWNHLMFECSKLAHIRKHFNIRNWADILQDKTCLKTKLLVAIILSSWTQETGKYLKFYLEKIKET